MQASVYDMIQWLKTLPSNALVECLSHSNGTGYYDQGGWCTTEPFDIQAGSCYYDGQGHWGSPYTYNQRWATEYVKPIPVRHVHTERRIA